MSEKEFIDWLKGFTQGVHHYNITPKQWDELKEKLATVNNREVTQTVTYDQTYWTTNTTIESYGN